MCVCMYVCMYVLLHSYHNKVTTTTVAVVVITSFNYTVIVK